MRRFVFVIGAPFCKRDYERYGMETFQRKRTGDLRVGSHLRSLPWLNEILAPPDPID